MFLSLIFSANMSLKFKQTANILLCANRHQKYENSLKVQIMWNEVTVCS